MSITGSKSLNSNNIEGVSTTGILDQLQTQVPINATNITNLQQVTTGITYSTIGDLTTINNNLTVGAKNLKCSYATTANDDVVNKLYCDNKIAAVVNSAPVTLDTLNELAIALGNDPNYATTTATLIGGKASKTETQTISGATLMDNAANIFYGDGSNLTGIASSTYTSIATTNLGINQIVPLINTQIAVAGNYELNIGAYNNILYNNDSGALTVNTYYGDGSNLSGLQAGITLTSLGINQVVPLINTQTSTAGNYELNIAQTYNNNILFNNDTGALTVNKYYGDGSSLTGIGSGTITTTTMPLTGTYYLPYTTSSTGASGLTAYSDSNIAFDRTNNRLVVPNLNMFGNFTMTGTSPIIASTLNNNLTLTTPASSTGSLIFQTQGQTRFYIATGGGSRFYQFISLAQTDSTARQILNTFYNLHDTDTTAGGTYRGRIYTSAGVCYLELAGAGHVFRTFIGGTNVYEIDLTKATFLNPPVCSTNCTTSSQLANKAYVDSVIPVLTNYVDKSTDQTITGIKTFNNTSNSFTGSVFQSGTSTFQHIALNTRIINTTNNGQINMYCNTSAGAQTNPLSMSAIAISVYVPTTFTNPPVCSVTATTANQLVNKAYVDNVSSNSNSPVGTIIMYGSNTIPSGWLLCNGSNVSKTTYADLWDVIGDTFLTFPPPTGFFQLPSFVGLYPRGAGYNAGLTSVSTTLGEVMTGQVGRHGHISASMNSNTQETTTSKSVVSSVSGLAGLVISSTTVSAPVITTTSTNGTTITTLDTYNPLNSVLTAETRPNNISINYIIKHQTSATPTPLTTPTFTQTTSVLTIQNNAPASGIINFTLDNASSVLQTPLSLSSTDITVSLPITCATAPTLANHLVNKTYVDGLVVGGGGGGGLTSTDQTITGVKTFSDNLITSADVFGRNDGNAFNAASSTGTTAGLYPIGYCFEILGGVTKPVSGADLTDNASIALTKGVWIISAYLVLNKGNGVYTTSTGVSALWPVNIAGIKLYPNSCGVRISIASTSLVTQHIIPVGSVNLVVTTAGAIQTLTRNILMTIGTTTSWQVSFTGVKIA